jgi:hypothetical protein
VWGPVRVVRALLHGLDGFGDVAEVRVCEGVFCGDALVGVALQELLEEVEARGIQTRDQLGQRLGWVHGIGALGLSRVEREIDGNAPCIAAGLSCRASRWGLGCLGSWLFRS